MRLTLTGRIIKNIVSLLEIWTLDLDYCDLSLAVAQLVNETPERNPFQRKNGCAVSEKTDCGTSSWDQNRERAANEDTPLRKPIRLLVD